MKKVLVLLSGGLDSSFAAYILKKSGFHVHGLVLKILDDFPDDTDLHNLRVLEKKLNMKIDIEDVREEFKEKIVNEFINTYKKGRTPNPCALCNPLVKFFFGLKFMEKNSLDLVASGHYADKGYYQGYLTLKMAHDRTKSQEYFLARTPIKYLEKIIFPLANFTKEFIKKEAQNIFPEITTRGESQDICFLRGKGLDEFLKRNSVMMQGNMVYKNKIVKNNINILSFTRGQRRGIDFAAGHRVYVKHIDINKKTVEIGEKHELAVREFTVKDPLFYIPLPLINECSVRVRYSKKAAPCSIKKINSTTLEVKLRNLLYTVTPGQLAVFYMNEYVLGSGWIDTLK